MPYRGARWLSGRVSDSGARGPGFDADQPAHTCNLISVFVVFAPWIV